MSIFGCVDEPSFHPWRCMLAIRASMRSPLRGASRSHHVDVEEEKKKKKKKGKEQSYISFLFFLPSTSVFRKRRRRPAGVSAGCANFRKRAPWTARESHEPHITSRPPLASEKRISPHSHNSTIIGGVERPARSNCDHGKQ
jgi:hypothetical protein